MHNCSQIRLKKYLNADDDENNIYFTFQDMVIIIYRKGVLSGRIRIQWNWFGAEWKSLRSEELKEGMKKQLIINLK